MTSQNSTVTRLVGFVMVLVGLGVTAGICHLINQGSLPYLAALAAPFFIAAMIGWLQFVTGQSAFQLSDRARTARGLAGAGYWIGMAVLLVGFVAVAIFVATLLGIIAT